MPKKETLVKHATVYVAYLLIVWGFYRFLFRLPEEVEEVVIKPVVWLLPLYFLVKKERAGWGSLGITTKNLSQSVYVALILGAFFTIEGGIVNMVKYGGFDFSANIGTNSFFIALALSFVTAVSEETAFRGYIFNRIWRVSGDEVKANLLTSVLWGLIHLPIAIFWWQLGLSGILGYFLLSVIFSIGSAFVFARTGNVASSILLHVFWQWPIILFR